MYRVVSPNMKLLREAGYPRVAHIPFLMSRDGAYPAHANRYLRARALCEWPLRLGTNSKPGMTRILAHQSEKSCIGLARRLKEFLDWMDVSESDLRKVEYGDLLDWQEGLRNGTASKSGSPLDHQTINIYLSEACYYLTWLSEVPRDESGRPARGPFRVTTTEVDRRVHRGKSAHSETRTVAVRVGALDHKPRRSLKLPAQEEVARWMRALRVRAEVKALMAEVIMDSGMRISEVNCMEVDTLPPREQWEPTGGRVEFWIEKGVKGRKVTPDSNVAVRGRFVSLSLEVAVKIDHYRSFTRQTQLRRWIRSAASKADQARRAGAKPVSLWLSEDSNKPFATQQLYNAWTTTAHCPKGWHPHAGREWFCVETVVQWALRDLQAQGFTGAPDLTWIQGVLRNQIEFMLRPVLGHLSIDTTNLYLRAAHFRLAELFGDPSLRWQDLADRDEEGV